MPRPPDHSRQTLLVFAALLDCPGKWRYGYNLMRVTGLRSGTLYPMLMRLYEWGWLERRWETAEESGGVPRHLYRATAVGRRGVRGALTAALAATSERAAICTSRPAALAAP